MKSLYLTVETVVLVLLGLISTPINAQNDLIPYPVITPDNAAQVTQIAMLGYGSITTSRWSPDGRVLAVGTSLDIRLYHEDEHQPLVLAATGYTDTLAFSPDSTLLASAHRGRVKIWEVRTGRLIAMWGQANTGGIVVGLQFMGNSDTLAIGNINFSESGALMATGVWLWDYRQSGDGIVLPALGYYSGSALAFNADHTLFVNTMNGMQNGSGLNISYLQIQNASSGEMVHQISEVRPRICQLIFSPTQNNLLVSIDARGVVRFWNVADGTERFALTLPYDLVSTAAFSPDGTQLATGGSDGKVRVWEVATGAMLEVYVGQRADISQLAYTEEGDIIAFSTSDTNAQAWNARTLAELNSFTLEDYSPNVVNVSFTPDGQRVEALGTDKTIRFWDIATQQETAVWDGQDFSTESTAISPDGRLIAYFNEDTGELYLWDTEAGESPTIFQGEPVSWISNVSFNTNSSLLAVSTFGNGQFSEDHAGVIRIWQVTDDPALSEDTVLLSERGIAPRSLAFSPLGYVLAYVLGEEIYLRNLETSEITTLPRQYNELFDNYAPLMTFSPDGRLLALQWEGSSVEFWDVKTQTQVEKFYLNSVGSNMSFSPNGSLLLVNFGWDARLYEVATGRELAVVDGHSADLTNAVFNQEGTLIATAAMDGTVRLWGVN